MIYKVPGVKPSLHLPKGVFLLDDYPTSPALLFFVIYGYYDFKNLIKHPDGPQYVYVGQTQNYINRHKDHFCVKPKGQSDEMLQNIGKEHLKFHCLAYKVGNSDLCGEAYDDMIHNMGEWMNITERELIRKHKCYEDHRLFNMTRGGQMSKKEAFIDRNHKQSKIFFINMIEHAREFKDETGLMFGACPRAWTNEDGYKLGEQLGCFRSNAYATIWGNSEYRKQLKEVGYTRTSEEAGVNKYENGGKSRVLNRWKELQPLLRWVVNKYGHANPVQRRPDPIDLDKKLIPKNCASMCSALVDIRTSTLWRYPEIANELRKTYRFFRTDEEFKYHIFDLALRWYVQNGTWKTPTQTETIPTDATDLPMYVRGNQIGAWYSNRVQRGYLSEEHRELISNNKKPIFSIDRHYKLNPEKKKKMGDNVRKTHAERFDDAFYEKRGWISTLKKYDNVQFGFLSHFVPPTYGVKKERQLVKPKWCEKRNAWFVTYKRKTKMFKVYERKAPNPSGKQENPKKSALKARKLREKKRHARLSFDPTNHDQNQDEYDDAACREANDALRKMEGKTPAKRKEIRKRMTNRSLALLCAGEGSTDVFFMKTEGRRDPPQNVIDLENKRLSWVNSVRNKHREKYPTTLLSQVQFKGGNKDTIYGRACEWLKEMRLKNPYPETKPPLIHGAYYWYTQQLIRPPTPDAEKGEASKPSPPPKKSNLKRFFVRELVSKYNSRLECYTHVRKIALRAFYFRRWFLITKC